MGVNTLDVRNGGQTFQVVPQAGMPAAAVILVPDVLFSRGQPGIRRQKVGLLALKPEPKGGMEQLTGGR